MQRDKLKTARIIFIIFVIAIVVTPLLLLSYNAVFTATLDVYVAPSVAKITLDGKKFENGRYKVRPGNYKLSISYDGFESIEKTIEIKAGDNKILEALESNSDATKNWYEEHIEDAAVRSGVLGVIYDNDASVYFEKYPIIEKLPYVKPRYRIGYGECSESDGEFCIVINAERGYRNEALDYLSTICDPAEYEIEYIGYSNPFEEHYTDAD